MSSPAMNWREFGDFRHMTCLMASKESSLSLPNQKNPSITYKDNLVELPIYPIVENFSWRFSIPRDTFEKSIETGCYGYF